MVPRTRLELVRITPHAPQTCAATNYATSAGGFQIQIWLNLLSKNQKNYLFVAVFALVSSTAALVLISAGVTTVVFELASTPVEGRSLVVSVVGLPEVVFKTETPPLIDGIASNNAVSIKQAAAAIVMRDKTDCVPRGPKAVLEMLLVKSAPASALPG